MEGWIGVDLDGTLAEYTEWRGIEHIGDPIPPMVNRVKLWLIEGKEVRIFTARAGHSQLAHECIKTWCLKHIGQELPITNRKDFQMLEYWDDRAVQVRMNTGERVGFSTNGNY